MTLLPGTEVHARGLRWEVVDAQSLGGQTLYRLRGLVGGVLGKELDLLDPFERIEPIVRDLLPERAAPLRNWLVYHQAFLLEQALGPGAFLAAQPGRLRIEPYQLVPVLRAIRMSRVRLLLADGVGLGKTIEAGLVLTELIARRVAHRVLIVSPAGPLLDQWKVEMLHRFGLRLDVLDRARIEEIRRSTELGANPFDHVALGLASIDFLKQERVLEQLERASYDVVILDEAHHCVDLGSGDREDSQRRRLADVLARRSDTLILLTATPHDGNDRSFASLCELLDPSLVDGRGLLRGERYRPHVVRRLKRHVPGFRERLVEPRPIKAMGQRFIAFQRELLSFIAPELRRAFRSRRFSDVLAYLSLLKRSVSTVEACRMTLIAVADRYQQIASEGVESQESRRQRLRTLREYNRKLERFGSVSFDEEQEQALLETEDLAQQLAALEREVRSGSREQAKVSGIVERLDELTELAKSALDEDPKLLQLSEEISEIRSRIPGANILIYTEYMASQRAALGALQRAGIRPILTMNGEDPEGDRAKVTERFRSENNLVLISTDAAAEGLNLHDRCHHLIHLELPFNPNRLEQRNGRIDRYGQKHDPIVRYLYLRGTFEERILLRLIAKYERQRKSLTFVPNTLGLTASSEASEQRLLAGFIEEDARLFKDVPPVDFLAPDPDEGADEATRELLEEVDRSLKGFQQTARTHKWLSDSGMNAEQSLLEEAGEARAAGERVGQVDLAKFVHDAVLLEGGDVIGELGAHSFVITLPPSWAEDVKDLPGYDGSMPGNPRLRLTTHLDVTRSNDDSPVGFLGRAHPLVRRALERVRNLSFGSSAQSGQDPRVSAVAADVAEPTLLYTFLGRVASRAGRELERLVTVEMTASRPPEFHDSSARWSNWADPERAIRTTDIWKQHFASWGPGTERTAHREAALRFSPIAEVFTKERREELEAEGSRLDEWLRQRANEVIGSRSASTQIALFGGALNTSAAKVPAWSTITKPVERLAGFASDATQPNALRSEADGVVRLYRKRQAELAARLALGKAEVVPLGLLMIIPEVLRAV